MEHNLENKISCIFYLHNIGCSQTFESAWEDWYKYFFLLFCSLQIQLILFTRINFKSAKIRQAKWAPEVKDEGLSKRPSYNCLIHFYKRCVSSRLLSLQALFRTDESPLHWTIVIRYFLQYVKYIFVLKYFRNYFNNTQVKNPLWNC